MGIKKEKKLKEEYIFDQDDFDKYVEYCKESKLYLVPKKEEYRDDKITHICLNVAFYFSFCCGAIPTIMNSYFFLFSLFQHTLDNYTTSLFILLAVWMISIQVLDLIAIRKNNKHIRRIILEIEENYNVNYSNWVQEIKLDYVKEKKKEFNNLLKYKKLKEKELKEIKPIPIIQYWMPSWIYFIIREIDYAVKYVGQTINPHGRKRDHYRKIYPKKDYVFQLIERKDVSEIDEREKFWIDRFGKENLDNSTDGGSAIQNRKGFKRKDIVYSGVDPEELERVEKWLEFTKNKNSKLEK